MSLISDFKKEFVQSAHNFLSTRTDSKFHFLFITTNNLICQGQVFPFYFYRRNLLKDIGANFSEIDIDEYVKNGWHSRRQPDLIFFQPWFNRSKEDLQHALARIKKEYPFSKIAFLDSYAPLDLRFAEAVDPLIDVYIKKQVFRDRSQYGQPTMGDTNLVDYYGKLYGLDNPRTIFSIPNKFLDKLIVGSGFEASKRILKFVQPAQLPETERTIDLHARLGGTGADWYGRMREHALRNVHDLNGVNALTGTNVKYQNYINEMKISKICFSPFGFGEVCWRDYEAMMCGALLFKPDMQHVEIRADLFHAYETYIPIKWDFSDLKELTQYYLNNSKERERIAQNAYNTLRESATSEKFLVFVRATMKTAGVM